MKEPSQIADPERLRVITETSPLSRTVSRDGSSVDVQIYRRVADTAWSFIVVNQTGTSIHWTEAYETDEDALRAFEADLEQDGIDSYRDDAPTTCPLCRALGL
ncbi:hypothetical protein [Novosphingobium sp.]|uniref:hypothetical protein n=1 Tax=Novosphingobium sp. TaxID=1874826 RepID=UPI0025EDA67C|nr:hypothetical protein [Novosphingobium sp.]